VEAQASTANLRSLGRWIQIEKVIHYIQIRRNGDGGYSFARGAESSAADTFYAIRILRMLGAELKGVDKTVEFMKSLQHEDGSFDSVNIAYYVIETLDELGAKPHKPFKHFILSSQGLHEDSAGLEVDVELPSELESTYLSLELLKLVAHDLPLAKTKDLILHVQNPDGSFGRFGYSRLGAIYHALASLSLLGFDVRTLRRTKEWVRSCEIPSGGFRGTPGSFDPYIVIDDIYFGVKCLDILDESCRYPSQTLDLIANYQNENGGFRRSIFLGISTFESTYYAISVSSIILARS
jgi:hypothetical protein